MSGKPQVGLPSSSARRDAPAGRHKGLLSPLRSKTEHKVKPSPGPRELCGKGGFCREAAAHRQGRGCSLQVANGAEGSLGAETSTGGTRTPVLSPLPAATHSPKWPGLRWTLGFEGFACRRNLPRIPELRQGALRQEGDVLLDGHEWDLNLPKNGLESVVPGANWWVRFWAPYAGHPDHCQSLDWLGPLEIAQVGAGITGDGDFTFGCYPP